MNKRHVREKINFFGEFYTLSGIYVLVVTGMIQDYVILRIFMCKLKLMLKKVEGDVQKMVLKFI